MVTKLRVVFVVLALVLLLGAQQDPSRPRPPQPPGMTNVGPDVDIPPEMQREMNKRLNKERQESLKKDTDKLFQLATELKQSVDKSNEHVMSVDVIRKAEEIEKLAKQVKEKMKG
ncbi:MAG TPA: hypothetical protein VE825_08280 [Terriglobales bacterium]|nr:hypothetical protein [Terriglobales bacterium]